MIKIGEPMAGQVVLCPQCNHELNVPSRSDPKAENLFQYMKKKRAEEKAASIVDSLTAGQNKQKKQPVPLPLPPEITEYDETGKDDVVRWIDQFWTSIPETEENGTARGEMPHTLKPPPPVPQEPKKLPEQAPAEPETMTMRRQQTRMLFRVWLCAVCLLCFTGGFLVHSALFGTSRKHGTVSAEPLTEACVTGTLYYRDLSRRRPDADAAVLFLPVKNPPVFPMTSKGLRPGDEPDTGEGIQQLGEIEGLFVKTGVDGSFSVPYKPGRYIAVFISSHSEREKETEPDKATITALEKYFKDPKELLGRCRFICDEYEFAAGKYVLQLTFP
ncbi:MAG: hypothetical protein LBN39_08820 [Planctomycetaceae bacterium]|nr:hypothetical protein [Planctomycetaceae bacterium]